MRLGNAILRSRFLFWILALLPLINSQFGAGQLQGSQAQAAGLPRLIGREAPGFVLRAVDGKEVSLSDFRGKALLVNFWATWCGACKLEMPWLAQLRNQYERQGFEVLGVLTDNASPETIAGITRKYGVTYPIVMCNHRTAQAYGGLPYLPTSFYIDRRGRVVAEMTDASSKEEIEREIRKTLAHGAAR